MNRFELQVPGGGSMYLESNGLQGSVLTIPRATEVRIFRNKTLQAPRFVENALGLYNFVEMNGLREIDITVFDDPEYGLAPRAAGCVWDPALMIGTNSTKMTTKGVQHQSELCADFAWNSAWRSIYGPGNQIRDIESTPESRQLLFTQLAKLHSGMSNDIWLLGHYGAHPDFEKADANGWWRANKNMNLIKWKRLLKQQRTLGGIFTMIDSLKNVSELDNFNIEIDPSANQIVGKKWNGDALKFIDDVIDEQLPEKLSHMEGSRIILLTDGLFARARTQIKDRHLGTETAYTIEVKGHDGSTIPYTLERKYVFEYNGDWYVRDRTQAKKDALCGTITHRMLVCAPGVFGVGYDVNLENQENGMGMTVSHWKTPPFMGKTYFSSDFELGFTVLGQNDYIANASLVLEPS